MDGGVTAYRGGAILRATPYVYLGLLVLPDMTAGRHCVMDLDAPAFRHWLRNALLFHVYDPQHPEGPYAMVKHVRGRRGYWHARARQHGGHRPSVYIGPDAAVTVTALDAAWVRLAQAEGLTPASAPLRRGAADTVRGAVTVPTLDVSLALAQRDAVRQGVPARADALLACRRLVRLLWPDETLADPARQVGQPWPHLGEPEQETW